MLTIASSIENWLPTQPEYGMGFQKVKAKLSSGGFEWGIIVNSQIFLKQEVVPWQMLMDWNYIITEAKKSAFYVVSIDLIPRPLETLKGVRRVALATEKFAILAHRKEAQANFSASLTTKNALLAESQELAAKGESGAAKDAPITLTVQNEIFKRFSAYVSDFRVTSKKGLTPGTFATTKEDADNNVKTGMDAISRYALANKKSANNVFTITPPTDTDLQRGKAQPANNEVGGGVEVIFVNGCPDGTVAGPVTIPEK